MPAPSLITGFRRKRPIDRFSADFFRAYARRAEAGPVARDALFVDAATIASGRDARALLFRRADERRATVFHDGAPTRLHSEAPAFVAEVLARPLGLSRNVGAGPGAVHQLLAQLLAAGPLAGPVTFARRPDAAPPAAAEIPPAARALAAALAQARARPARCVVGRNRTAADGPLTMTVGALRLIVPDELSTLDALAMAPTPIPREGFANAALQRSFARAIDSANERYAGFVAAGLDPDQWRDAGLSISQLNALARLRRAVRARLAQGGGGRWDAAAAAFAELAVGRSGLAGFRSFREFAASHLGAQMIRGAGAVVSLDQEQETSPWILAA